MVTIRLNGEPINVPVGCTVRHLLEILEMKDRLVAVEINSNVIPKTEQSSIILHPDDQVEVVTLVGGG